MVPDAAKLPHLGRVLAIVEFFCLKYIYYNRLRRADLLPNTYQIEGIKMHIIVADHKVALVTDMDDVAWDISQDWLAMGICKEAYCYELYEDDFDENGKYVTDEGDTITIEDCNNAEHVGDF